MPLRFAASVAALLLTLGLGVDVSGGGSASVNESAGCSSGLTSSAVWARLATHVPRLSSCDAPGMAAGHAADRIAALTFEQFPHTALELNGRVSLDMAPVSGQNATWIAADRTSPIAATCRKTVTPNPGALVLPNPRNGQVVLVCRNLPRP